MGPLVMMQVQEEQESHPSPPRIHRGLDGRDRKQ